MYYDGFAGYTPDDSFGFDNWAGYDEWLDQWEEYQANLYWGDQDVPTDDDIFVLPDFPVTPDSYDDYVYTPPELTGNEGFGDYTVDYDPLPLDYDEVLDPTPDPDITAPYQPDPEKLKEIRDRFKGTRRAYNEWRRTEEGQKQAQNLGEKINQYLSPSEGDPLTKADALTNQIINLLTGGGLEGLDAFAEGINILEGALGLNIVDIPNGGYFANNLFESFVDEGDAERLKELVPDFVDAMTGIRGAIDDLDTPTAFLANDFDLSDWLLGDTSLIREIDFGLNPAQEQLDQQAEDYYRELLGPDYEVVTEMLEPDDPNFFEKLQENISSLGDAFTDITQDIGFTAQKYLGGALPRTALNLLGGASLGLPIGTIIDIASGAMTPSGQNLSEYLYERGIDPTTATRRDVAAFVADAGYDVPDYDPATGDFNVPVTTTDSDAGFLDNLGGLVGGTIGDVISGDTGIGGVLEDLAEGTTGELTDIGEGITGGFGEDTTDIDTGITNIFDDTLTNIDGTVGTFDGSTQVFTDDTDTTTTTGDSSIIDDTGIVTGGTGMEEDTVDTPIMGELGDVYDPAYFTALALLGADRAEAFRGRGLADPEFRDILGTYTSETATAELERLAELNRLEQERINEQRAIQRAEDLGLLGEYGMDFAEAVRGLDPAAQDILGQQSDLASRLYRRAAGDLTAEEEADAAERAFEISAMAGPARAREGQRFTNVLRAEEDILQNLEQRAQAAGGLGFNMARTLTGDIPSALLGTGGSPYGTGVGTIVPPFGTGDVISQATTTFAQQQNVQKAEQQLQQLQGDYQRAISNNEPSTAEQIMGQINQVNDYLNSAKTGVEIIGALPQTVSDITGGVQDIVSGIGTFFGGGSTAPSADTTDYGAITNVLGLDYGSMYPDTNVDTGFFGNFRF